MKVRFEDKIYESNKRSNPLRRLAFEIFKKYVVENPNCTYQNLQKIFNKLHGTFSGENSKKKVVFNESDFLEWWNNYSKKDHHKETRYFKNEPVIINGEKYYFTTQWGDENLKNIIDFAKQQGYNIEILEEDKKIEVKEMIENNNQTKISLNQILYGPPGTGKTYGVIERAIEIIEGVKPNSREEAKAKFKKYQEEGQIEFVTFHQSYSYEEFVEGLKAKTDEKGNIYYEIEDGIFKKIVKRAQLFLGIDFIKQELSNKQFLKLQTEKKDLEFEVKKFKNKSFWVKTNNGSDQDIRIEDLKNLLENEKVNVHNPSYTKPFYKYIMNLTFKELKDFNFSKKFILIIDEINRGNISKIFGELITLIEEDKRLGNSEEIKVRLPYSKEDFGVPKNLYIIGTMNTADRSIALMDTALRRRFEFVEMMPEYDDLPEDINGINIGEMLKAINEKIEFLYDRDHTIGHAYFIDVKTFDELKEVFKNKIIPLLQEYFYDDWEKIRLILNNKFIKEKEFKYIGNLDVDEDKKVYEINNNAFEEIENYKKIYDVKAK